MRAVSAADLDVTLGAAMSVKTSPYKDHKDSYLPTPLVLYDGPRFYAKGAGAGVYLFNNETHKISVGASYFGLWFDPDDTSNAPLKELDKRKSTLMGDLAYAVITPIGLGKMNVSRDLLGHSDGYVVDASWNVPFMREKYAVMPSIGVEWSSRKQADYYYGVSAHEAARSGLKQHTAKANFSPYVKVEGKYDFNECWSAVAGVSANFLTGSMKNSPMVGRSVVVGGFAGLGYTF